MKRNILFLFFLFPLLSLAQSQEDLDLLSRNLISIEAFKALKKEPLRFSKHKNFQDKKPLIDECTAVGDFYVSSREQNAVLLSNFNTLSTVDSLLPASPPYGGSIGIISEEGTLINSRFDSVSYYTDNGWAFYGHFSESNDLIHCAGGNQTVYYMGGHLWHLNGNDQPQMIYENIRYTCADLVVDSRERAWVLTGTQWPVSDTLRVIDSTGLQICKFPLVEPFNTINAYGMMMYQNQIWLGLGDGNALYPSQLLPLEIIDNQVVAGTPLAFADDLNLDLESCEVGLPEFDCEVTSIEGLKEEKAMLTIFPNPGTERIEVVSERMMDKIELVGLSGRVLQTINPQATHVELNLVNLAEGIYFVKVYQGRQIILSKQIKK